jgi:hypothetical protein
MLASILTRELVRRYDEDWYRNPKAGPFLRDWLAAGLTYDARELATKLDAPTLGAEAFVESIHQRLSS